MLVFSSSRARFAGRVDSSNRSDMSAQEKIVVMRLCEEVKFRRHSSYEILRGEVFPEDVHAGR